MAQTGWDRPLQYFYLVVESLDPKENNEYGVMWSNLDEDDPSMTLDQIKAKLDAFGIPIPPTLLADLEEDRRADRGNAIKTYVDGKLVDE